MSELERRLHQDKALRDAALGLFKADLALIRAEINDRGIGERIKARLGEGTADMIDEAVDYAEANQGKVAAIAAALVLWFGRGPIFDALSGLFSDDGEDGAENSEPAQADGRSPQH